jgi:hypothetical protein
LFHSARWKAYLKNVPDTDGKSEGNTSLDPITAIYYNLHSQKLWFTREEDNGHGKAARKNLEKCDSVLKECTTMVDNLEETLANTPKPSEMLDWARLW